MTTRSSTLRASARPRWRGSNYSAQTPWRLREGKNRSALDHALLDLLVGRGEVAERHRDRDRFLRHGLERHFQLLPRFQGREQVGCDRRAGIAASGFAGLDLEIDGF